MQQNALFQEQQELARLSVQSQLLHPCETPVFTQLFSGQSGLNILDIGCNNGSKTVAWFSSDAVSSVIGLEFNAGLAKEAQSRFGSDRFSFYACDVESDHFSADLQKLMDRHGVEHFDVIYLSLVLMHLRNPSALLQQLRSVLKPNGLLIVLESNDYASVLPPPHTKLLQEFLDMLQRDPFAGNRSIGPCLPEMVTACGYTNPVIWFDSIQAQSGESAKKDAIFQTLFSYLPEDVLLLCQENPNHPEYQQWAYWLQQNFEQLKQAVLQEDTPVTMGVRLMSCRRN